MIIYINKLNDFIIKIFNLYNYKMTKKSKLLFIWKIASFTSSRGISYRTVF